MKTADILLLVTAAAVLGGVLFVTRKKIVPNPNINNSAAYGSKAIPVADGAANGWQYFTDGTAIGPDGKYYFQGVQVYDPAGMYGGMAS